MQAEYMAGSKAAQQGIMHERLLLDLNRKPPQPVCVLIDNKAAIQTIQNDQLSTAARHIRISFHKVREYWAERMISVEYVNGKDNVADLLTKSLDGGQYLYLRDRVLGFPYHQQKREAKDDRKKNSQHQGRESQ
jgi:hypothetical protein